MSFITPEAFLNGIQVELAQAREHRRRTGRPFCTLAYAQSLDGCIARRPMGPMSLSGPEAMALTHQLRSWHDAILVGIRTVIADNPRLSVRLVRGQSPQPVVLDSQLRMPPECHLLTNGNRKPWIATSLEGRPVRQRDLESRGAKVLHLPTDRQGWVALEPLLEKMGQMRIDSLMVEGGARVLTSFMRARLVDQVVITLAPVIVGGVHAFLRLSPGPAPLPHLREVRYAELGRDLMVWGQPLWGEA
ncbi:MAG: RibD family protein [Candidatus Tectomicrobia bacterium]|uniref:RibD family protein n=1 Tax=Tectimicrobiota bacterium TaxID=2528274 RepID=A0A932CLQ3_UNCTE|nr:RibD family protein [Candidatus Tectomicrobia bacterium]